MDIRTLNHFSLFRFKDRYWQTDKAEFRQQWLAGLREVAPRVEIYQTFPLRSDADLLVWSAMEAKETGVAAGFFARFARATNPLREFLEPVDTLWGFTKPSVYSKGRTAQEIDPFADERKPYLIMYPFVKTAGWYLMDRATRQGMMNEHIRVGRQYPEITQLLLYSVGLQDQEFVVVYETEDVVHFSNLVAELRGSQGRRFTLRDTPIYTAAWHPAEETLQLFE